MKALPFKIPITSNESFLVQEDLLDRFYGILHTHPEIQITLILESTGTLFAGDYIGDFKPGDLFVIGSDCPHVLKSDDLQQEASDASVKAHAVSLFLGTKFLNNQLFEIPEAQAFVEFMKQAQNGFFTQVSQLPDIKEKFLKIRSEKGMSKLILLFQIIETLSSCKKYDVLLEKPVAGIVNEVDGKRLNDIFEYTLEHFTKPITIEEISDIAFLTPQSFCRFFKRSTRKTYVSFLNELRINKATQLLRNKELSVSEISFQCGFNNLSHFNRQFLMIKKKTPSESRNTLL